jgi:hypothetical protein
VAGSDPVRPDGRGAFVISQLYYYVVAVIGVGLVIGGAIAALFGVREMAFPRAGEAVREGVRSLLQGLVFAGPGAALVWSHLRAARRREGGPAVPAFWGRALYFHLVALVALVFALIGTVGALGGMVDLAAPLCPPGVLENGVPVQEGCFPTPAEAGRQIADMSIFVVVAAPVWWWHLREGRRATQPPPAEEPPGATP